MSIISKADPQTRYEKSLRLQGLAYDIDNWVRRIAYQQGGDVLVREYGLDLATVRAVVRAGRPEGRRRAN